APDEGRRGRPDQTIAGDGGQARRRAWSGRNRGRSGRGTATALTGPHALIGSTRSSVTAGAVRAYEDVRAICPYSAESCGTRRKDRKSTRLNSSHVSISYA